MDRGALQVMLDQGQLQRCPMDAADARARLEQARADARTAGTILCAASSRNPKGAASLAWEATLECLFGWLILFGYRITSERGHHAIAVRAVRSILDTRESATLLQRLDGLRRLRDNALYNNLPVDPDEVMEFMPDIDQVCDLLGRAIDHVAPAGR